MNTMRFLFVFLAAIVASTGVPAMLNVATTGSPHCVGK